MSTPQIYNWTDVAKARFRVLWDEGKTASEIAIALFGTEKAKNAVCGMRTRMKLPSRGSPIASGANTSKAMQPEKTLTVIERLKRGVSIARIAAELHVSKEVIARIRDANNIPIPKPGPALGSVPAFNPFRDTPRPQQMINSPAQNVIYFPIRRVQPLPARRISERQCQWLEGDEKPWVQCEHGALAGTSWCRKHRRIVYRSPASWDAA